MSEADPDPEFARVGRLRGRIVRQGFEEQCKCKVSASYMGSSDELVAKLRGGSSGNYDVISPSSDVATIDYASGLAAPLDLAKIALVQPTLRTTHFPATGEVQGKCLWRSLHVGAEPAHL